MRTALDRLRLALQGRPHQTVRPAPDDRFAAVAAILRENLGTTEVLLIRRAWQAHDPWSGHMAFPGGRHDPEDPDLLHTALRETKEEVGLKLEPRHHLLGRLDDLPAVARGRRMGIIIAPFVFALETVPEVRPNAAEVSEVIWTPLEPLARGERNTTLRYELEGRDLKLPAYDVDGRVVWGLTHRMLEGLFTLLDAKNPKR